MYNLSFQPIYVQSPYQYVQPIYYMPLIQGYMNPVLGYEYPAPQMPSDNQMVAGETQGLEQINSEPKLVEQEVAEPSKTQERISKANKLKENFNKKESQDSIKKNAIQKSTNIQKNYAKAIVHFALRLRIDIIKCLGEKSGIEFLKILSSLKNNIKNINHLKNHTQDEEQLKLFRIISNRFLKHHSVQYVYNSNIQSTSFHLRFRHQIKLNLQKC